MRHVCVTCAVVLVVAGLAGWMQMPAAQARLEFREGLVYLSVKNASVESLLRDWERLGGTKVLVKGPLPTEPLTLELEGVSEARALDAILAATAGYVARERLTPSERGSRYTALAVLSESDLRDGGVAVRRALDEAEQAAAGAGAQQRIMDYRDLPPRDPNDPNTPVALTPASPGDVAPPPLAFGADDAAAAKAAGRDPGVNPIPLGILAPNPQPMRPASGDPTVGTAGPTNAAAPAGKAKPGEVAKPIKPPGAPGV